MKIYNHTLLISFFLAPLLHGVSPQVREMIDGFAQAVAKDASYAIFKKPELLRDQQNNITTAFKAFEEKISTEDKKLFSGTINAIKNSIAQIFSMIHSIRRHILDVFKEEETNKRTLNEIDRTIERERDLKDFFEKLNKKMIEGFVKKLKDTQTIMNKKFSFTSNIQYRNNNTYQALKEISDSVNTIIKKLLTSKKENGNYQELLRLMTSEKIKKRFFFRS